MIHTVSYICSLKILFASEERMGDMENLKEEVTSLNYQLQLARQLASRKIAEKMLDCTNRIVTKCNETEKLRSLEHVLRNEIATGQTALARANEEVTSLNSQLQCARHDATVSGKQIIELRKLLDCTKSTLSNETEKLRSLEHVLRNEIATGQTALARANVRIQNQNKEISSLHSLQQKYDELAENQETKLKQLLNENKNLKQGIGDLSDSATRSETLTNRQEKHIMELTRALDCTKRTLCNETEKLRPLEQKISSLNRELTYSKEAISKQQKSFNSAEHGRRTEIATVKTTLARANSRIQNQSKDAVF